MTTAKKIKILNSQLDKLQVSKEFLEIFYVSHWQTETLEYFRVFFGADSEIYKKCKHYNDAVDEEHKTKSYSVGSAIWVLQYTDILFSAIGVLQHELHKKSKILQFIHGLSLTAILAILTFIIGVTYTVGRYEGIKTGQSIIPTVVPAVDTTNKIPRQNSADSTTNKTKKNHLDSNKN